MNRRSFLNGTVSGLLASPFLAMEISYGQSTENTVFSDEDRLRTYIPGPLPPYFNIQKYDFEKGVIYSARLWRDLHSVQGLSWTSLGNTILDFWDDVDHGKRRYEKLFGLLEKDSHGRNKINPSEAEQRKVVYHEISWPERRRWRMMRWIADENIGKEMDNVLFLGKTARSLLTDLVPTKDIARWNAVWTQPIDEPTEDISFELGKGDYPEIEKVLSMMQKNQIHIAPTANDFYSERENWKSRKGMSWQIRVPQTKVLKTDFMEFRILNIDSKK